MREKADVGRKEEGEEDERDRKGFEERRGDPPIRELLIGSGVSPVASQASSNRRGTAVKA